VFVLAVAGAWWYFGVRGQHRGGSIVVYYTTPDGAREVPWTVSLGPARDRASVAFYAATQALAGPASEIDAIRFPAGTHVRTVDLAGSTVTVDLSKEVDASAEGGLTENGEFKALVWTLTDPATLPGVTAVRIAVGGVSLPTLPGGHLELDEPLTRASF
jgi:hypothetical protein